MVADNSIRPGILKVDALILEEVARGKCCRQLDPTGDTERPDSTILLEDQEKVADNSIRPGILKEYQQGARGNELEQVADNSIRPGILKGPPKGGPPDGHDNVADNSIRPGILKEQPGSLGDGHHLGCRQLDPTGDTESSSLFT